MKKQILTTLVLVVIALVGCGKKSDNAPAPAVHPYIYTNGYCMDTTTNQYVQTSYCTSNLSYYMNNGICYSMQSNMPVDVSLCTNPATNPNSGMLTCVGTYYFFIQGSNQYQQVTCATGANNYNNCRGYTLVEAATGRQVLCQ